MSIQTNIRVILTLLFLAMLTACGQGSTTENYDLGSTNIPISKVLATCNKAGTSTLSYKSAAQVSGASYDPNWSNLYLTNLPIGFEVGTTYVQFYKGQTNGDANIAYATSPVSFGIFNKNSGQYLTNPTTGTQAFNSFVWNDVKTLIASATTPASFVSQVIFVLSLQDPQSLYPVLSVRSYNTTGNTLVEALPSLLPTFYANPTDYAMKPNGLARETVLRNLHPLRNQVGNFTSLANNLCL